ncbi:MAG: S-formylglutathione hydrolase [Rhizobiales bacterium]|nr:S-formylglutathione hydrolase [Hyphomicrobiales bacterium]NRB13255.1 S-formylglutathione hydrolase [Hyphomicrobiales bacterium]
MPLTEISANKCFDGWLNRFEHFSSALNCKMKFSIFLPLQANDGHPVPVIYFLSGLTCTDENFMQKSGVQRLASKLGVAIVTPDTSPRGTDIADDPEYDMGQGAGFYLNATQPPWDAHYKMYDYIVDELPKLIDNRFPVTDKRSLMGHSMGGHGALTIGLKNPDRYRAISAFAPICNPSECPWGQKAFSGYLGEDKSTWQQYDATYLIGRATAKTPILIEQGLDDAVLNEQLKPENLIAAAIENGYPLEFGEHHGYDHGYHFIATFIDKHLHWHYEQLMR